MAKNTPALEALRALHGGRPDLVVEGASTPKKVDPLAKLGVGKVSAADVDAYGADSTEKAVEGDSLALLQSLAAELVDGQREINRCIRALKDANDAYTDVAEHRLPDLMERYNLPRFEFVDRTTGVKLIIKLESDKWRVSMPPMKDDQGNALPENFAKRKAILDWLREGGNAGSIKKEIAIQAGLLGDDVVEKLVEEFTAEHPELDIGVTEKIEPATFTALISRLLREGQKVHEAVQVKPVRQAKVAKK